MKTAETKITGSMEDYLEAIAALSKEKGEARVNEIGELLRVKNSSVNSAVSNLAKHDLVRHERYGSVELTSAGEEMASAIQKKHDTLYKFLTEILAVDPKTADRDACKMEHALSSGTSGRLIKFIEFIEGCPEEEPEWLINLKHYFKTGKRQKCKKTNSKK